MNHCSAAVGCCVLMTAILGTSSLGWAAGSPSSSGNAATLCRTIDQGAAKHGLPTDFFTRLLWKESGLRANAVSPVGAQGIAQFMPQTAASRGLANAFDPAQAIPASAHYLSDLQDSLGNLGLAAAAYNAGEGRVSQWVAGRTSLPAETQDYVLFITGQSAHQWKTYASAGDKALGAKVSRGCAEVAAALSGPGAGSAVVPPTAKRAAATSAPSGAQLRSNLSKAKAKPSVAVARKR